MNAASLEAALGLIYIVDLAAAANPERLDAAAAGGMSAVWLRAPGASGAACHAAALDLVARCRPRGVRVIVGDRADVALAAGADGVQLGFRSPPVEAIRRWFPGWLGVSCHTQDELSLAQRCGADYATLSPVFETPGKGPPIGLTRFGAWSAAGGLPVVALGGIGPENAAGARAAGAAGVAVIRALRDADAPQEIALRLRGTDRSTQ